MAKAHNRLEIDVEYVVAEYLEGRTAQDIATELGVSKKSILTRLKEEGVQRRMQSTYPEITKELLEELYINQKLSTRNIAEIFGCSSNHICKRLKRYGIQLRKRVGDSSFTEDERKAKWGRPREEHNLWKGGVTGINETLRNATTEWRKDEMKRQNYTCFISGIRKGDMHVHHVSPFHELRDRLVEEMGIELKATIADYSEEVVELMREKIVEMHKNEHGYVITAELHKQFHRLYGFKTTKDDLLEFKNRYQHGEFNEIPSAS